MWFRVFEITLLGFFLSFIYLRHGIIPVLIGHYLFNAFWNSAGYIFGKTNPFFMWTSLFIICLPLLYGVAAFILNKKEHEGEMSWKLSKHQLHNLEILKFYLQHHHLPEGKSEDKLKKELLSHGWDIAVIEAALEYGNKGSDPGSRRC